MSKKAETKFRSKIRPLLDLIPNSFWESISQRSILGTPDILGTISGVFIALELKSFSKATVTAMQKHKLHLIVKAGGYAFIVCPENWNEVYGKLIEISKKEYWD